MLVCSRCWTVASAKSSSRGLVNRKIAFVAIMLNSPQIILCEISDENDASKEKRTVDLKSNISYQCSAVLGKIEP